MALDDALLAACALALVAAVLAGANLLRRLRRTETALDHCEALAATRGRCLGLLARELEAPALTLLSQAPELAPPHAAAVDAAARRFLALADEVSDVLSLSTGPRRLDPVRIALGPLLRETLEEVGLIGTGRHWRIAPEAEAAILHADRRALKRILFQALARAVRETRPSDWIALRLDRTEDTVALVVEDEGAGLSPGDLTAPGGTRGVGLGLATARDLMRAHGGDLVTEAAPGIGARTWLTFPAWRVLEADPVPA
ncbi:sensor histidine kinase [Roseomonas sp. CCTCC AB2023176]|uniref:sensor histidine kinase n=1 Tax=Roseomonas sp. CCTCC AB2023176 TaxID=3342640 RepID=UPI0035E23D34